MARSLDTPTLAYPFEILPSGKFREVEQRSLDDIAGCVEVILRYRVGERVEVPEFGIPELAFRESVEEVSGIIRESVLRWEPDADLLIEERPDLWDRMVQNYMVTVGVESA